MLSTLAPPEDGGGGGAGHVSNGDQQSEIIEEMRQRCEQTIASSEAGGDHLLSDVSPSPWPALSSSCPPVWDGILCWPRAQAGETAILPCPDYIVGFDATANASRRCLESGEWFWVSGGGADEEGAAIRTTWTNFSQCTPVPYATMQIQFPEMADGSTMADTIMANWVPVVKNMSRFGYGVSFISLVVAFIIMSSIKKLRCPRNILHMHLFASFIMRAFMSLLKDSLFIDGIGLSYDVVQQNGEAFVYSQGQHSWECKMVISLWQFFIMANYSWVLMEGLYLHNLIFMALFSDTSSITFYVILGWGFPVLVVVPWIVLRAVLEDTLCWTTNLNPLFFLVIRIPIIATILINFVLFLNIIRVVFLKLQSSISEETRKYKFRRWAKSTLVLVPLFGVHYTVFLGMSYSMKVNPVIEIIWLFCDQFFASLQGVFIAVLYCFMNGEVRAELTRKWFNRGRRSSSNSPKSKSQSKRDASDASSSGAAGGSYKAPYNNNNSGAGGVLSVITSQQQQVESRSPEARCKKVGFDCCERGEVGLEDDGSAATGGVGSGGGEVRLQSISMTHFPRFGRQMSAPAGSGSSRLSLRGGWGSPRGGGTIARALARSEFVQGTKRMAKKWSESMSQFAATGATFGAGSSSSGGADSSSCTTDCSVGDDEDDESQVAASAVDERTRFLPSREDTMSAPEAPTHEQQRHHQLHRSLSDGAALRMKYLDDSTEDWITVNETSFDEKDEYIQC
ncbi:vasoactive intestinal polypeptide receptor 2-like [Ischnura elegans]|uniref:vasoactive intestinal polypeptide receptor 2-like n=1 Tax=Ischnura elegans TaxID=197161 RepID=UPI001ED8B4DE|nr:vasoactive intestinal polypeptide receptor 2-like [Ischnura elegans]XP_046396951.1 vasoactive intestinal polypeptide receptor 2-like [Ischnura elegans]